MKKKISWKTFLIALGVYGIINTFDYKQFIELKKVYDTVNSNTTASSSDLKLIELVRKNLIKNISESDVFKRTGRIYILDSLKSINIKVVDTITIVGQKDALGCYFDLNDFKSNWRNVFFKNLNSNNNFILLAKKLLKTPEDTTVIAHEIFHYFDKMLGNDSLAYSEMKKLDSIFDQNIDDTNYVYKKMSLIDPNIIQDTGQDKKHPISSIEKSKALDRIHTLNTSFYPIYIKEKRYITSPREIFSRYLTAKNDMISKGILKSLNQKMMIKDIQKYIISQTDYSTKFDTLELFYYLNLDKLDELDKIFLK